MSDEYTDSRDNTRDQIITFCIFFGVVVLGIVAAVDFAAPWWIYAGIGFFFVVVIIALLDQKRLTGRWLIHLTYDRGGKISSPSGVIRFEEQDLIGVYMAVNRKQHDRDGAPGGYYLVLRQGAISLNNSALKIDPLIAYLNRTRPQLKTDERVDINELLDQFPAEPEWVAVDEMPGEKNDLERTGDA